MSISYHEVISLTCSRCMAHFSAEAWLILDAHEQPEKVDLLHQGYLNRYACPQCGQAGSVRVPLLFHDAAAQVLIFAPAAGQSEYVWREQVRDLHALLVEGIPEELRRAYLEDVQIAQDIEGVAHILHKRSRRSQPAQNAGWIDLATSPHLIAHPNPVSAPPHPIREASVASVDVSVPNAAWLIEGVQQLMRADSPETVHALVQQYPALSSLATDLLLKDMADQAVDQREYDLAEGLRRMRLVLAELRTGGEGEYLLHPAPEEAPAEPDRADTDADELLPPPVELSDRAWQVLLGVQSSQGLIQAVQEAPVLLEDWVDAALADQIEHALEEGNERLAHDLEVRRAALEILRENLT